MSDPVALAAAVVGVVAWFGMAVLSALGRVAKGEAPANGEYACLLVAMAFAAFGVAAAT